MAKDPAFLFYPNDYIGGTMGMTFEEKGAYMELLMMQFNRGHMTNDMIGQTVGQLWVNIKDKFIQDGGGLWYNKRLEDEQTKRQKFTESRRNNKDGKNQYSETPPKESGHTDGRMEDEDVNINKNVSELEDSEDLYEKLTFAFWKLFDHNMQRLGVKSTDLTKAKSKVWVDNIRKMIEIDQRSESDIAKIYKFLKLEEPKNGFAWAMNIRSTEKLRKNFEKVLLSAKNSQSKTEEYDREKIFSDLQG